MIMTGLLTRNLVVMNCNKHNFYQLGTLSTDPSAKVYLLSLSTTALLHRRKGRFRDAM